MVRALFLYRAMDSSETVRYCRAPASDPYCDPVHIVNASGEGDYSQSTVPSLPQVKGSRS